MRHYSFISSGLIIVTGKDASRYLNARLTCNVKDLQPSQVAHGAQLTAQGKCQGIFTTIHIESGKYLLLSAYAEWDKIISDLRQFIVADRVDTQNVANEYRYIHLSFSSEEEQSVLDFLKMNASLTQEKISSNETGAIAWGEERGFENGIDALIPAQQFYELEEFLGKAHSMALSDDEMLIGRAKLQKPAYPIEIDTSNIFSEASLKEYVSYTKGCYVGQEVIERIDAMGKTAWKIASYSSLDQIEPKSALNDNMGTIINCSHGKSENWYWGFVKLRNDPKKLGEKIGVQEKEITVIK